MKKILAFSSIRSDYDLMSSLYKMLNNDPDIDFKIIVSGAHLSSSFGNSVNEIRKDGFDILIEIESLLNSDSSMARLKSASLVLQGSLDVISKFRPDLILYAGDREDVLIYSMIGGYLNIPTIHVFAGDHVEDGYIDNPVRHATSKLSTAHFVTLEEHKKRLVRMGEHPSRVFVTGNISLDKFLSFKYLSKKGIHKELQIKNDFSKFCLVIFHPVTSEIPKVDVYFENILKTLESKSINAFVSYPNVDPGNRKLLNVIEKYEGNKNFYFYKNLNRKTFMSIFKHSSFIIGNSSAGVTEAASLGIPAVNVGRRQTGRYADRNVIFCGTSASEIKNSVEKVLSVEFLKGLKHLENSYGSGESVRKAYDIIKKTDFRSMIEKTEDPLKVVMHEQ